MKKGVIKTKITADYIIDMYERAKQIKDLKKKKKLFEKIKLLSSHLGEYIVKIEKDH
jgi:hypothetical protein